MRLDPADVSYEGCFTNDDSMEIVNKTETGVLLPTLVSIQERGYPSPGTDTKKLLPKDPRNGEFILLGAVTDSVLVLTRKKERKVPHDIYMANYRRTSAKYLRDCE